MILALIINNSLLGDIPESIGLLLFGLSLIALTVGLRWFIDMNEQNDNAEENLEKLMTRSDK